MAEPQRRTRRPGRLARVALGVLLLAGAALGVRALQTARRERAEQQLAADNKAQQREARTVAENEERDRYRGQLALARSALAEGRPDGALAALQSCPDSQRGFEWGFLGLVAGTDAGGPPAFAELDAAHGSINDLALSADGRLLAAACDDGRVLLDDAATGERLHTLRGHASPVLGVSFSPDGRRLASCSGNVQGEGDASIRLWDTATGDPLALLSGHTSAVCAVAFSPDGQRLASVSGRALSRDDDTLRLWDSTSGACLGTWTGHEGLVSCVEFSPDGRLIATGSSDRTVLLWESESGRPVATLEGHSSAVLCLAFSPDGRTLASGSGDPLGLGEHVVRLWDVGSRRPLTVLSGHDSAVFALAWSPDGRRIASGSGNLPLPLVERGPGDTSIRLWDAADGELLLTLPDAGLPGSAAPIWELAFTPDGARLVSAGDDGALRVAFSRADDAAAFAAR